MKKIVLVLSIFLLISCGKPTNTKTTETGTSTTTDPSTSSVPEDDGDSEDDNADDNEITSLYEGFKVLLNEVKGEFAGSPSYDSSRCDAQAMHLIASALNSIENRASFQPEAIGSGMSNLSDAEIPKNPSDFIKRFIADGTRCGMPDLISRMKKGRNNVPYDQQKTKSMEAMLNKLRSAYP